MLARPAQERDDLVGGARIDHCIRRRTQVTLAQVQKVQVTLAARMRGAFFKAVFDRVRTKPADKFGPGLRAKTGRGNLHLRQGLGRRVRKRWNLKGLGNPGPRTVLAFQRIMGLDPTPAIPARIFSLDGHG